MKRARIDWFVVVSCLFLAVSCSGGGCGGCGMEPIPGGFTAAKRHPNAGQVRVSQNGLAAISADPAALLGSLGGGSNGVLSFNVPSSCGGSTPVCCPGGNPQANCGPLDIDLTLHPGDQPRLELHPQQGASTLNVTVRARLKTEMDIPVTIPIVGDCGVKVDTNPGSTPDVQIDLPIAFEQDGTAGTTRINVGSVSLSNLTSDDVALTGGFGCQVANFGLSAFLSLLTDQLTGVVQSTIQDQTCKACPSGDVAECGSPFATACTGGVCQEGNSCLQELGIDGRLRGSSLFASLSPGTTGALDLYEVAGGYATTNTNGIALGLLGGMEPGGAPRDRCGPMATEPTTAAIPQSSYFQGNTRPDTGATFDVAIGLHKSQLAQFAYAGYDGGLLCLTIGASTVSQLSTDTLSLLSRSLGNLVERNAPMAVGLRPQSPPTITLGKNTFTTDGSGNAVLDEPLLDIKFTAMEIDFFAMVDQQYIRVFTVVSDVHLPVGLQVGAMGELTPVLGNVDDAFTNLSVKNSEAVTETPDSLAMLFPNLLSLVLPQLSSGLPAISVPSIGGLNLAVTDITAVDDRDGDGQPDFLAIFANLTTAMARPVHTTATIADVSDAKAIAPRTVTLELGGDARDLEFSYRVDDTTWSAWGTNRHPVIKARMLELPGTHHIDVRARAKGQAETTDLEPVRLAVELGGPRVAATTGAGFHGQAGQAGCNCDAGPSPGAAAPLALLVVGILVGRRRSNRLRRLARSAMRLGPLVWLIAIACLPGCSCSSHPCGDSACMDGEVQRGAVGRFTSIAGDDQRVMVATYDQVLGDLVAVDVTDPMTMQFTAVDGIPGDVTPTYDPSTYRGGISDAGPNVGAWTSIALSNHLAKIAYQDRDNGNLKYAFEKSEGTWDSYVVDGDATTGEYASMTLDSNGHPAIAYIAVGIDDGMGHRATELRLARAGKADPQVMSDWTIFTIASAPGSCGGLCDGGTSCVADAMGIESCVAPTTDCSAACATGDVCVSGSCVTEVVDPMLDQPPQGTGLFVSLVTLPDGRLAAAYYDGTRRALVLSVENAAATSQFTENILDGNVAGADRGMWSTATVATDGTVHVAYQDALGDQLMYTTWNGTPGVPEVVDDGTRTGDRTHPVGAGAVIYLNNGTPTIAYQDGLTADVYTAVKAGAAWMPTGLATGPLLDGFSIAVTTGHGTPVLAWDTLDPSQDPANGLTVLTP
jgi:MYXO-CTERM domain-containing protein